MQRRSTTIFLIGLLTLVLGTATTFAALHGNKRAAADSGRTRVKAAVPMGQPSGFTIPTGKQALAVALDSVAGTAGTATAGSHIDVFTSVTEKAANPGQPDTHATKLILQDVEVLAVNQHDALSPGKDANAGPSGDTVFILAVTPEQAERVVYHASFSKLWFSVLPADAKPVPATPGVDTAHELEAA
jgi:Flp pilus assembly protein CpaB